MIREVDIAVRYSIFGYLIGEGFRNVFKNKKSTIASLIIMCATMFVFGIFFAVGENINHITKTIENQQGMEVFIYDEATEEQKNELETKLKSLQYVNTVKAKSKADALESVKNMFKDKKDLIATYEEDNPFRASYVVTLTDLTKLGEAQAEIQNYEIVEKITAKADTVEAIIKIANGIKIITTIILIILVFISIFIITNTIKLTVHARRKEISIMKYVGATNSFIRWPFMVEGMLIGLISVLISILILSGCYNAVLNQIAQSLANARLGLDIPLLTFQELFKTLLLVYLALGIGIGALGSAISMKKYLEV